VEKIFIENRHASCTDCSKMLRTTSTVCEDTNIAYIFELSNLCSVDILSYLYFYDCMQSHLFKNTNCLGIPF
jgi:hypothetical protein